jgi:hypothetical protein
LGSAGRAEGYPGGRERQRHRKPGKVKARFHRQ